MPTSTRHEEQLDLLKNQLHEAGYDAEMVGIDPVKGINIWKRDQETRLPVATVVLDERGWAWGHSWEWNLPASSTPGQVLHCLKKSVL